MRTVAVFLVSACLTIFAANGQPGTGKQRCLCQGPGLKRVRQKLIEKVVIHPVSAFCGRLEVVVMLKNGAGSRCLNPKTPFTQDFIGKIQKRKGVL